MDSRRAGAQPLLWVWLWFERIWQDLHHGGRMLLRNPGFTLVAVVSLAIGIGANSAIFSFADALLFRPLPVARPGEIVTVGSVASFEAFGVTSLIMSYRDYLDLRDRNQSFDGLAAFTFTTVGLATDAEAVPRVKFGTVVTGNFFQVMGVQPDLGRGFLPEEDQVPDRDAVVVLGYDFWLQQFSADRSILGRKLRLNGSDFTVIGVAPARFPGMNQYVDSDFYVPTMMWPRLIGDPRVHPLEARDYRNLTVKGRLKHGVSLAQAQAEVATILANLEKAYPDTNRNQRGGVRTELQTRMAQSPPNATLVVMLMTLAAAVLVVACANVASLLTSRAPARAREISVRLAIGASRPRLIRQLITESLLLAVAGGVLGLGIGYAGVLLFRQIPIPSDLPVTIGFNLDRRAMLFSLAVALVSAVLFGLAPAIQSTRTDLASVMKTGDTMVAGRRRLWGRGVLVAMQVGVALVLLTASLYMYRGFGQMLGRGPGYRTDHLLMMSFNPKLVRYDRDQTQHFYEQLVEGVRAAPGVKSAALGTFVPMGFGGDAATILPEGYQFPKGKDKIILGANRVDEGYFETSGVAIVRGRGFRATDKAGAPRVAVVNEALAQHYWVGQDAIGKRFRLDNGNGAWVEIVGVAKTSKYYWIAEAPTDFLYLPERQDPREHMILFAESIGDARNLVAPLTEVVRRLDANQPISDIRTMEDFYQARAASTTNIIIGAVGAMGAMGLVLAIVGLYGLVAYAASRRTREIGIRMAIGAGRGSVVRLVLRQGLVPAVCGMVVGLAGSVGVERLLHAVFPANGRLDFMTLLSVVPILLAVTMLAAYVPAYRASRLDPMKALRYE